MGYSQHWFRPIEIKEDVFQAILSDVEQLCLYWKRNNIKVETSENDLLYIEGFVFPRIVPDEWRQHFLTMKDGRIFQFCKTNRERFEIAVQASLIIAKHHLRDEIIVTSNGGMGDWEPAIHLVQTHLGYGRDFVLEQAPGFDEMSVKIELHPIDTSRE